MPAKKKETGSPGFLLKCKFLIHGGYTSLGLAASQDFKFQDDPEMTYLLTTVMRIEEIQ